METKFQVFDLIS